MFKSILFSILPLWCVCQDKKFTPEEYIAKYKQLAVNEMACSGIPASVTMAQAFVESGFGNGTLAVKANNHFGIKCKENWRGPTYYLKDDDYKNGNLIESCFRKYQSVEASFYDHTDFLCQRKFYKELFSIPKSDYRKWCKGLVKAGYASLKDYDKQLISVIERYRLYQLDTMKSNDPFLHSIEHPVIRPKDPFEDVTYYEDGLKKLLAERFRPIRKEKFKINGRYAVVLSDSLNFEAVARKYHITRSKLLRFNENKPTPNGYYCFLEKKAKRYKSSKKDHKVQYGETIYDISQRFGIQMKKLYKRNHIPADKEIEAGSYIALKGKQKKKIKLCLVSEKVIELHEVISAMSVGD